jgi:hypothetical protein
MTLPRGTAPSRDDAADASDPLLDYIDEPQQIDGLAEARLDSAPTQRQRRACRAEKVKPPFWSAY